MTMPGSVSYRSGGVSQWVAGLETDDPHLICSTLLGPAFVPPSPGRPRENTSTGTLV